MSIDTALKEFEFEFEFEFELKLQPEGVVWVPHMEQREIRNLKKLFWDLPFSEARSLKLCPGLDF